MAKAVKIPQDDYVLQLTLSRAEAEALRALFNRVGGDPKTTRRGLTDQIAFALSSAGVDLCDKDIERNAGIRFETRF